MSKQGKPILILRTHFVADGPRSSFFLLLQQVADFREQLHFLAGLRRFCGSWHLLFLAMELRDEADENEDGEGDDDEIKRGLQEVAIVEQHGGLFLSIHTCASLSVMERSVKFTPPQMTPIRGMMRSDTMDDTIFPKAVPITTPTAISTTLPRMANALKSCKNVLFDIGIY